MLRSKARWFIVLLVIVAAAAGGWQAYLSWHARRVEAESEAASEAAPIASVATVQPVRLPPQAQRNLELVSKPLKKSTYWRKLDIPGVVVDRPGISDRGVVAPVSGIVTHIYHFPGDTVEPESPLFSVRLVSESLHASQLELFKATREIEIAHKQRQRLGGLASSGAVAQSRIIEIIRLTGCRSQSTPTARTYKHVACQPTVLMPLPEESS